jgi:RNA polymerase sigma factor (sigma-70 family)
MGEATNPARENVVEMLPALRAFARTFYRNQTDADDLVQETLVRALNSYETFTPGTRLKSWLFTIMRNAFYTQIKKSSREPLGVIRCISDKRSAPASQEWTLHAKEVEGAIHNLPAHQREVLVLITIEGMSYEDAARVCACNVGTIKSRLNRARARLSAHFDPGDVQ